MKETRRQWSAVCLAMCLAILIGLAATGSVLAAAGTSWDQLTPAQRQLLQKAHEDRWNAMSAEQQQRMLKGAERWQKMTPEERARIRAKREKFRSMSPEERAGMREKFRERREAFAKLPPEQQQAIRDCRRRRHEGEDLDCRSLWPQGATGGKPD